MLNERLNFVVKIHKNEHLPKNLLIEICSKIDPFTLIK